jgi:uncharacterized membrane protein required for colicin V production
VWDFNWGMFWALLVAFALRGVYRGFWKLVIDIANRE